MKNKILEKLLSLTVLVAFFSFSSAQAAVTNPGFDYLIKGGGQTYPLGGIITAQAGYGVKLWEGSAPEEGPQWKYGYLRPAIELQTAGTVNRASAGLEIYPISILGIRGGYGLSQRTLSYVQDFDCSEVMCDETLNYDYLQANLMGGYQSFILSVMGKYEKFTASDSSKPFYEEMSYLVGQAGHDDLRTLDVFAGYKLSERWTSGVRAIYQEFVFSQNNSSSMFAVGSYTEGFWNGMLALGQYKSSHQDSRFSAILSISYNGIKGIGLFD
jgi:hypothetical protein